MNVKKSIALLLAVMMVLSLAACGAKGETGSGDAMTGEPKNAEEAVAMHKELMAQENAILSENTALWEKVFMAADKSMTMQEDGKNYGDFLLDTIESAKDQFTADEFKALKAGAQQVKEIEEKLTALEKEFPGCGSTPGEGESVDASTAGMTNAKSEAAKFPSFKGKDLDGNDVNSDELFSNNKVTVMNFWFTTCKPCVGELSDLEELNKALLDYYISRLDSFEECAKKLYGCNGIFIPAGTTPNMPLPCQLVPVIINWTGAAGWLALKSSRLSVRMSQVTL